MVCDPMYPHPPVTRMVGVGDANMTVSGLFRWNGNGCPLALASSPLDMVCVLVPVFLKRNGIVIFFDLKGGIPVIGRPTKRWVAHARLR